MRRGQPLFAVDGQPVTLLYGSLPAWRPFAPGMTAGPDVRQLQRNLAALGFDPGPADGEFGWATQLAVQRWQQASGETVTGTIPLGAVAFLPGPLRVTTTRSQPGAAGRRRRQRRLRNLADGWRPGLAARRRPGRPAWRPGDSSRCRTGPPPSLAP